MIIKRFFAVSGLLALIAASSTHAQVTISNDTTYDGTAFNISPAANLIVSDASNDPLLLLTGGATSTGAAEVFIGMASGSGRMHVDGGSSFAGNGPTWVATGSGATGELVVTGVDSSFISGSTIYIGGDGGMGTMEVSGGATFSNSTTMLRIGYSAGGAGLLDISGTGTNFQSGNWVSIGGSALGTMRVRDGAKMVVGGPDGNTSSANRLQIGHYDASRVSRGLVEVVGNNSRIEVDDWVHLGRHGSTSELRIMDGGYLSASSLSIYNDGVNHRGLVLISGENSELELRASTNAVRTGRDGIAGFSGFRVEKGGLVSAASANASLLIENSSATLSGIGGTIGIHVNNQAGTVAPAVEFEYSDEDSLNPTLVQSIGEPGVLTIDADYSQGAAGTLILSVDSSNDNDRLHVTGDISLGGALVLLRDDSAPDLVEGTTLQLLSWEGSLAGQFQHLELFLPGESLMWNTDNLYTDGVIEVVADEQSGSVQLPMDEGLVAYWDFEGGLTNRTLGGIDAAAWSGYPVIGLVDGVEALAGNALILDGQSSIQLPYNVDGGRLQQHSSWQMPAFGNSFTIAAWYWISGDADSGMSLLSEDNGDTIGILWNSSGLETRLGGQQLNTHAPVEVAKESWRHFAMVVEHNPITGSSTLKFYDNGELHHIGTTTEPVGGNALRLGGGTDSGSSFWKGMLDEVAIWSRPLTATEIQAVYENGEAGKTIQLAHETEPSHDPIAYWSFDTDFSATIGGAHYDAEAKSGALIEAAAGPFGGGALRLNRAHSQYVEVPNSPFGSHDYTYAAWFALNRDSISGTNRYFILEASDGNTYPASLGLRRIDGTDQAQVFTHYSSPYGTESYSFSAPTGEHNVWRHVVVTYSTENGQAELYIDGELVESGGFEPGLPMLSTYMNIGAHRGGTGRNWDGWLAEVAVWGRVLTKAEISNLQTMRVPEAMRYGVSGYNHWIRSEASLSDRDPLADAVGSGIPNVLRYAVGYAPDEKGPGLRPKIELDTESGFMRLTVTLDRNPAAQGINYSIEYSYDLQEWEELNGTVLEDSPERLQMQVILDNL